MAADARAKAQGKVALGLLEGRIRRLLQERLEFTKDPKDRIRRTTVYAMAQEAGLVTGWNDGQAAQLCTRVVVELGGMPRFVENRRTYSKVRIKESEFVPGEGKSVSDIRRAWWARMVREGYDAETASGNLRELPHYREYRREINVAFFERAAGDYWRLRKHLDIWGLYALEGLSVREIAERMGLKKTRVHEVVQAMRQRMDGQPTTDEETDDDEQDR